MRSTATRDAVLPLRAAPQKLNASDKSLPPWALVLSTYRRREVLMLCLTAAVNQSCPPREVIIVDASPDWRDTRDQVLSEFAAARPEIRWKYVEADRRSLPAQRNQGIALSTAPILFMIDDDSIMYHDCAEQILTVYAADTGRKIAGVGATEAENPSSDGSAPTKAPPGPIHRIRRKVRWNVAKIFDRGPESFLPYDGRWSQPPVPAEFAHLDLSTARALNGFRMTFRREVIIKESFLGWFVGYAPLEDLDASHRASRHGLLVNAHAARLRHLTHHAGRPNHYCVAAQWVMSNAVLQSVFGQDRPALARAWRQRVNRFLLLELVKDLAKGRLTLPAFRGILHGSKQLARIYAMDPQELERWYPQIQDALMAANA
jgi:glycosyltransferase involved in cell wall biosynthesis